MLAASNSYADVLIWSLLLMGLVIVGLVVAVRVKRRVTAVDTEPAEAGGFTLSDLRAMHRSGQMSDEEYEKARGRMVAAAQRAAAGTSTLRDQRKPSFDNLPTGPGLSSSPSVDALVEDEREIAARRAVQQGEAGPASEKIDPPEHA